MPFIQHNVSSWFGTEKDAFVNYFNNEFENKTIGKVLAYPVSTSKRFEVDIDINYFNLSNAIANTWINAVVKLKFNKFKSIPFNMLEIDTIKSLRDYVCEAVQNAIMNRNIWERTNGSSISGGSFSANLDMPSWTLTGDMCGKYAWNLILISGIDDYFVYSNVEIEQTTENGNTLQIIGKLED